MNIVSSNLHFGSNKILNMTGALMIGKPKSEVVKGTIQSIKEHKLEHRIMSASEVRSTFPIFQLSNDEVGVFETEAGYLHPERCIATYQQLAERHGAKLRFNEALMNWHVDKSSSETKITVRTTTDEYRTKKLILTMGAWAPTIFGDFLPSPMKLQVERRVVYYFKPTSGVDEFKSIPVYLWDTDIASFYGFPVSPLATDDLAYENEIKIAIHQYHSQDLSTGAYCTPESIQRSVSHEEVQRMRDLLGSRVPHLNGELSSTETCMYTTTPDGHL